VIHCGMHRQYLRDVCRISKRVFPVAVRQCFCASTEGRAASIAPHFCPSLGLRVGAKYGPLRAAVGSQPVGDTGRILVRKAARFLNLQSGFSGIKRPGHLPFHRNGRPAYHMSLVDCESAGSAIKMSLRAASDSADALARRCMAEDSEHAGAIAHLRDPVASSCGPRKNTSVPACAFSARPCPPSRMPATAS